jgi:chemotaxis protein methyltransferase CheR
MTALDVEDIEVPLLLDAVSRRYGIDLREYARASLRRRIRNQMREERVATLSGLQERLLHDPAAMERLLAAVGATGRPLFHDAGFFRAMRQHVVPILKTYPFVRVWHAGCSTGEDVIATAILLEEEGLAERCRIYATDVSESALKRAKEGIFPASAVPEWERNYREAGGTRSFADHHAVCKEDAIFNVSLRKNIVFAPHNLASDGSFNEFNLIVCRDVLIGFKRALEERVHRLLHQSLATFGVLALGARESLRGSPHEAQHEPIAPPERLYRRIS